MYTVFDFCLSILFFHPTKIIFIFRFNNDLRKYLITVKGIYVFPYEITGDGSSKTTGIMNFIVNEERLVVFYNIGSKVNVNKTEKS